MQSPIVPIRLLLAFLALLAAACNSSVRTTSGGGAAAVTPEPLRVTAADPPPGSIAAPSRIETGPLRLFRFTFSRPLDREALAAITPVLAADLTSGDPVAGSSSLENNDTVLVFRPRQAPPADIDLEIRLSPKIQSTDGVLLELDGDAGAVAFPAIYQTFLIAPRTDGTIQGSVQSSSAIEVSWAELEVVDNTALPLKVVEIFTQPLPEPLDTSMPAARAPLDALQDLLTGLAPATTYRVALRVMDELGNTSNLSAELLLTTASDVDTTPPAYDGVGALEIVSVARPQVLRASWQAAVDDRDGSQLLRYVAYVAMEAGAQDFDLPGRTSEPGATEMEIDGLSPDTTFYVVIRAVDTSGNEDSNAVEAQATTPASFAENVFPILTRLDLGGCTQSNCHSNVFPRNSLNMTTYADLMRGGRHRNPPAVLPGNGKGSYILWRTDVSNPNYVTSLSRMPLGRPPLSNALLRTLERWIDQGAVNN